jgi:multiple sugar transport system substrate-binding protein
MIKKVQGVCNSVIVTIIIAATIVAGISVGYGTIPSYAKEPVTLRMWNDKIGWTSVYEKLFKDFTEETGINVEVTGYYDIEGYIGTIKTLVGKPEAPDVFTWWSGKTMEELADTGELMDITFAYEANPGVPKSVMDTLSYKGWAYGIPISGFLTWPIVYDKRSFAKAGCEPPKTWDEFIEVCEKLKAAGITPFANGWASWQGFIFPHEIAIRLYPDWYEKLNAGKASYTDAEMKEVFQIIIDMNKKGYFGDPNYVLTLASPTEVPTSVKMLARQEAAMLYYGEWITGFLKAEGYEDWGMFMLPNINPAIEKQSCTLEVGPLLANKGTTHPEETKKLFKWLLSPEGVEKLCSMQNWVPWNIESSKEFLPLAIRKMHEDLEAKGYRYLVRYWEAAPTKEFDVRGALISAAQKILVHPEELDTLLAEVQEANKSYWEKYGSK